MWLKTQPNPIESFNQYDYEFIKGKLEAYLAPEGETIPVSAPAPVVEEMPAAAPAPSSFKVQTQSKATTTSKFDDLFSDDDDDNTDLPF
jgi:pyruvate/2-oxoglutarate dehydrogenase complex dihydrolipoamide acyltransferase (E2) component